MKIIVPMAGRGSRLRPHSLTVPKPLIPVAGQSIVHRLVKDIAKVLKQPITEVAFVLGDPAWFGDDVVDSLTDLATSLGAKSSIYRQDQPLGTGHAIMCAKDSLSGPAVIAYADTLIRADFNSKSPSKKGGAYQKKGGAFSKTRRKKGGAFSVWINSKTTFYVWTLPVWSSS